jgi:SAM-dependent methyltransferase
MRLFREVLIINAAPEGYRMTKGQEARYIPALGHRWLTPLFDPLLRWALPEATLKRRLIQQANIQPGQRVLDLGCGTATLTIMVKQMHPQADVVGLDGDPEVLDIARRKAARAGVAVRLEHGLAFQLPYPDQSFDRVVSSLVFHHLASADKRRTFADVLRVLPPGGELHILDFGKPHTAYGRFIAPLARRLEQAADNVNGLLPGMMREAGFVYGEETAHFATVFGTLALYQAGK